MPGWRCSQYVVIIVPINVLISKKYLEGTPAVAVIGGEAYMRWTISTSTGGNRYVYGPDNKSLILFINKATEPYDVAQNVNYTGIMSFTLYGVTPANVGKYKYILAPTVEDGGLDLVIAGGDTETYELVREGKIDIIFTLPERMGW